MTFLSERPLFSKSVKFSFLGLVFEVILVMILSYLYFFGLPELQGFRSGLATVRADPSAIAMIGLLGIYGARISTFVAMIRRNRMPQVIEWWCTLIGLAMLIAWPLDGVLLRSYASLHGYEFCHELPGGKVTHDLFVLHGHPCPG